MNNKGNTKFELTQEQCYCNIIDLYDLIAQKLGYDSQDVRYDCTKICVSKLVQKEIFRFYKVEENMSDDAIGQIWLFSGPKANLPHNNYIVDVQNGFVLEDKS